MQLYQPDSKTDHNESFNLLLGSCLFSTYKYMYLKKKKGDKNRYNFEKRQKFKSWALFIGMSVPSFIHFQKLNF